MFAYEIINSIKTKKVIIDSELRLEQLLFMILYNNIVIPDNFVSEIKPLLSSKLFSRLVLCLNTNVIPISFSSNETTSQFFSLMYKLNIFCTKNLRDYVASHLVKKDVDMFFCGYRSFKRLTEGRRNAYVSLYATVEEYFRSEIGKEMEAVLIKSRVKNRGLSKKEQYKKNKRIDKVLLDNILHKDKVESVKGRRKSNSKGYSYCNAVDKDVLNAAMKRKKYSPRIHIISTPMGGSNKKY